MTNQGPSDASAPVRIVDNLPVGLSYVSASGGWSCTAGDVTDTGQQVSCELPGSDALLAGASAPELVLVVRVAADLDPAALSDADTLINSAEATTGTPGTRGTATDAVLIEFSADLVITKTHTGSGRIGDPIDFTITVVNNGPSAASGVTVSDPLPDGLSFLSAGDTYGLWSCAANAGTVSCDLNGLLAPAESSTITLRVQVDRAAWPQVTNQVSVQADTPDPVSTNNTASDDLAVLDAANVTITKTADVGQVNAGDQVSYRIVATNEGPAPALGVLVDDALPAGLSLVSVDAPDGWTCNDQSPIQCSVAQLATDSPATITVVAELASGLQPGAEITNMATITTTTADDDPADNADEDIIEVTTEADLVLEKTHSGAAVHAGEQTSFALQVSNAGPSDAAADVVVTDRLPVGMTYVSASDGWECQAGAPDDSGQQVVCELASGEPLIAGANAPLLTMTVLVGPGVDPAALSEGELVNHAAVESPTTDPDPDNNESSAPAGIDQLVDLQITKSHTGTAVAGRALDFELAVTNAGPSDELGEVSVSDELPAGMAYRSATGDGWTCSANDQLVDCTRDGLAAGATSTITLQVELASDAGPGTIGNTATVSGVAPDSDPTNNTGSDQVEVVDTANLQVTKTAVDSTVTAGKAAEFDITVTNLGPSDADDVELTELLPDGMTLVSITPESGWVCVDGSCTIAGLAAGDSAEFTVKAKVASSVADGSELANTATVSTSTPESDDTDNSDTAAVSVQAIADLSLTKSHPDGVVLAGEPVTFTIAVANAGPSDAVGPLQVSDLLPAGMTYQSAGEPWQCETARDDLQQVSCTLADGVAAGESAPDLELTALVKSTLDPEVVAQAGLTNFASVSSPTTDAVSENNEDTDTVEIGFSADLGVSKVHEDPVRIGDDLWFTIEVTNHGPSLAREVIVTDIVPDGLQLVSAEADGWTCAIAGNTLDCAHDGGLAVNSVGTVRVHTTVTASAYPEVSNTVTVAAATEDPVADNNTATDQVTVPAQVDLGIVKSHVGDTLAVGDTAKYTLTVTNFGPTDEPGPVRISDPLPEGLTYVSATGQGWTCAAEAATVSCELPDGLAAAETSAVELSVEVAAAAYPQVSNTATVTSSAEDLDETNNTATDTAQVDPSYALSLEKTVESAEGSAVVWRIAVINSGPTEAPVGTVVVTDELPDGLTLAQVEAEGWECETDQAVVCRLSTPLAGGETAALLVHTLVGAEVNGELTNVAALSDGTTSEAVTPVIAEGEVLPRTGANAVLPIALAGLVLLGLGVLIRRRRN